MKKEEFINILTSTNREGMEQVLAKLEELGFYDAPLRPGSTSPTMVEFVE